MENVFFKPWVGENYSQGYLGKKVLVLGESHYCDSIQDKDSQCGNAEKCLKIQECQEFTSNVLGRFFDYKKGVGNREPWMTAFTRFTNIFLGEQVKSSELLEFWDNVMFFNYVQIAIKDKRISPTEKDFATAEKAFFEILEEYKPDLIIVWGDRLWKRMPGNGTWADFDILNKPGHKFYYYEVAGKKIPAYAIYHPSSSRLTYDDFSETLKEVVRIS